MPSAVRRNTVVLAGCMTFSLAVWQLIGSAVPLTTARLAGGVELAGAPMSLALLGSGLIALPAGRFMDRYGRVPGICLGFFCALAGALVAYLAVSAASLPLLFAGLALLGLGLGTVSLARVGAADMYPPERRATAIGWVLAGAAVGAVGGSAIFTPLLRDAEAGALSTPWLVAAGLLACGAAFVWLIRVDPIAIARERDTGSTAVPVDAARGLRVIYAQPSARLAFLGSVVATIVMTSSMPLMAVVLSGRGHDLGVVSLAFGGHLFGMYALAPVAGQLVDRIGRVLCLSVGLLVLAVAVLGVTSTELAVVMPAMFFVGVGWNVSYVAATALLADATAPSERALALGATDLTATVGGALGSAASPALLAVVGLGNLVLLVATVALVPAILIARRPRLEPAPA